MSLLMMSVVEMSAIQAVARPFVACWCIIAPTLSRDSLVPNLDEQTFLHQCGPFYGLYILSHLLVVALSCSEGSLRSKRETKTKGSKNLKIPK